MRPFTFATYGVATLTITLLIHDVFIGALTNTRPKWEFIYSVAGLAGMAFYVYQWRTGRISTLVRNLLAVAVPVTIALVTLIIEGKMP